MADQEDLPEDAPHVFVRGEGGSVFKLDLPLHETIEERLLKGYLIRVANAAGDAYFEGSDAVASVPTERPPLNADKRTWVGWAVHEGMLPDDAEGLTKTDLIEKFGAKAKPDAEAELAAREAAQKAADDTEAATQADPNNQ